MSSSEVKIENGVATFTVYRTQELQDLETLEVEQREVREVFTVDEAFGTSGERRVELDRLSNEHLGKSISDSLQDDRLSALQESHDLVNAARDTEVLECNIEITTINIHKLELEGQVSSRDAEILDLNAQILVLQTALQDALQAASR